MVLTATRLRSATGTATGIAFILVLAFGNPAYRDWAANNTNPASAGGFFLRILSWPAWRLTTENDTGAAIRDLLAADLRAILVIALTAALLGASTGSLLSSARGSFGTFMLGWGCFIVACALAGLLTAFISANASLLGAFQAAAEGSVYGLFAGWLVGIGTAAASRT